MLCIANQKRVIAKEAKTQREQIKKGILREKIAALEDKEQGLRGLAHVEDQKGLDQLSLYFQNKALNFYDAQEEP